jgi:hypothetical protein
MGRVEDIFEKIKREGESAIDEFILVRQAEELYLDFKRSADDGKGPRVLHQFTLHLILAPPLLSGKFLIKWTFGCEGSPVNLMIVEHTFLEIEHLYR